MFLNYFDFSRIKGKKAALEMSAC